MSEGKKSGRSIPPPRTEVMPGDGGPVFEPMKNDVLCGRGGRINSHIGNIQFRIIVNRFKRKYLSKTTKKLEKAHVAAQIVTQIRRMSPSGRFLKEENGSGVWYDIGDDKAIKKAGQALREDAPDIRHAMDEEKAPSKGKHSKDDHIKQALGSFPPRAASNPNLTSAEMSLLGPDEICPVLPKWQEGPKELTPTQTKAQHWLNPQNGSQYSQIREPVLSHSSNCGSGGNDDQLDLSVKLPPPGKRAHSLSPNYRTALLSSKHIDNTNIIQTQFQTKAVARMSQQTAMTQTMSNPNSPQFQVGKKSLSTIYLDEIGSMEPLQVQLKTNPKRSPTATKQSQVHRPNFRQHFFPDDDEVDPFSNTSSFPVREQMVSFASGSRSLPTSPMPLYLRNPVRLHKPHDRMPGNVACRFAEPDTPSSVPDQRRSSDFSYPSMVIPRLDIPVRPFQKRLRVEGNVSQASTAQSDALPGGELRFPSDVAQTSPELTSAILLGEGEQSSFPIRLEKRAMSDSFLQDISFHRAQEGQNFQIPLCSTGEQKNLAGNEQGGNYQETSMDSIFTSPTSTTAQEILDALDSSSSFSQLPCGSSVHSFASLSEPSDDFSISSDVSDLWGANDTF